MKIMAHRGFWTTENEKNSATAFTRALSHGFGIETDVRDVQGEIAISHDPFKSDGLSFLNFFNLVRDQDITLAMNVKADGLANSFAEFLKNDHKAQFVFFDMSGPEHFKYIKNNLAVLNRISEYETVFKFPDSGHGVWLDAFESEHSQFLWLGEKRNNPGETYIVSPEIHGRNPKTFWEQIRSLGDTSQLTLCTDLPLDAMKLFGE